MFVYVCTHIYVYIYTCVLVYHLYGNTPAYKFEISDQHIHTSQQPMKSTIIELDESQTAIQTYLYMCICLYAYSYICTYVHIYIYMYICIYVYICVYIYIYMCLGIPVYCNTPAYKFQIVEEHIPTSQQPMKSTIILSLSISRSLYFSL